MLFTLFSRQLARENILPDWFMLLTLFSRLLDRGNILHSSGWFMLFTVFCRLLAGRILHVPD